MQISEVITIKRLLTFLLCFGLFLTVTACGKQASDKQSLNAESNANGISAGVTVVPSDISKENNGDENKEESSYTDSAATKPQNKIDFTKNVSFTAQTPFSDTIDSSVFADYDLTMINIWGTLCKPCIKEMPDIQKIYEDMQTENVNVIGFIANYQDDRVEKAKEILIELKITYSNVIFDDDVSGTITSQIPGYPTTVFVDNKGNVVGELVTGARSYEEYKSIIKERLEECTS